MKRDLLKFRISIGSAIIQDIENGIVNIGMSVQRNIGKTDIDGDRTVNAEDNPGKRTLSVVNGD